MNKFFYASLYFLLFLLILKPAYADTPPVITGRVSNSEWIALTAEPVIPNCSTRECIVLKKLIKQFRRLDRIDFPNSMTRKTVSNLPGISERFDGFSISEHQLQLSCQYLDVITRGVDDSASKFHAIEIAENLAQRQKTCLDPIREYLKESGKVELMERAYQLCEVRKGKNCALIKG